VRKINNPSITVFRPPAAGQRLRVVVAPAGISRTVSFRRGSRPLIPQYLGVTVFA